MPDGTAPRFNIDNDRPRFTSSSFQLVHQLRAGCRSKQRGIISNGIGGHIRAELQVAGCSPASLCGSFYRTGRDRFEGRSGAPSRPSRYRRPVIPDEGISLEARQRSRKRTRKMSNEVIHLTPFLRRNCQARSAGPDLNGSPGFSW